MNFRIFGQTYSLKKEELKKVAKAAFSVLGKKEGDIELKFVSPHEIKRLNSVYRNMDEVTDVLSFIIEPTPLIGQIFICYTKMKGQAKEVGITIENEAKKLIIHGICHLYGLDHETDAEEKNMKKLERKIGEKVV